MSRRRIRTPAYRARRLIRKASRKIRRDNTVNYRGYRIFPGLIGDFFVKQGRDYLCCTKSLHLAQAAVDAALKNTASAARVLP